MEQSKTNTEPSLPSRYPKTNEAQRLRKKRDRLAIGIGAIAIPVVTIGIGALNSDRVEESPRSTQEQSIPTDERSEDAVDTSNVDPDSIRTVTFDQQANGSFDLSDDVHDSSSSYNPNDPAR